MASVHFNAITSDRLSATQGQRYYVCGNSGTESLLIRMLEDSNFDWSTKHLYGTTSSSCLDLTFPDYAENLFYILGVYNSASIDGMYIMIDQSLFS